MEGLNIFPSYLSLLATKKFHPESKLLIPHQVINPRTSQDRMLLSFKLTCFPRDMTGSYIGMCLPMNPHIQHSLQAEQGGCFIHRRAGPAEGAVAALSLRTRSTPSPPAGVPAEALPSQGSKSLCRAQPWCCCCECGDNLPGEATGTVPSQRQEQDFPLSATSSALLFGALFSPMKWVTN